MYLKESDFLLECGLWGHVVIPRRKLLLFLLTVTGGICLPLEHEACPPVLSVCVYSRQVVLQSSLTIL